MGCSVILCSTSFDPPQNGVYKYPDIYVCLYDFFGCDKMELEGDCMGSAQSTEGGRSTAVFNLNRDDEQELEVNAFLTEEVRVFGNTSGSSMQYVP